MANVGLVTCQILELELAHILSNDPKVQAIWVVYDGFSSELVRILKNHNSKPVHLTADETEFKRDRNTQLSVLVRIMEVGLHSNIPVLTQGVKAAVEKMAPFVDTVLLGYGLCGNALGKIDTLFKEIPIPVMLPMDGDHPVDDCVGLIIGGRTNYYAEQCRCAGTMFMNAGFSRHWDKIMVVNMPPTLLHKKEMITKRLMRNYKRSLLLPTTVLGESELRENIAEFNRRFNLRTETRPGTLSLFENAWAAAKRAAGLTESASAE